MISSVLDPATTPLGIETRAFGLRRHGRLRSLWIVLRLGCFQHAAYAERYFGSRLFAGVALLHFVFFGEKKGFRPNAFFDPAFFGGQTFGSKYADYLTNRDLWIFPTSAEFQVNYYLDHHGSDVPTHACPLIHFLREGFEEGFDPSPLFETNFCKGSLFRDMPDTAKATYHLLSKPGPSACLTATALQRNQQRFFSEIEVHPLRVSAAPRFRRDILLLQAGADFDRSFSPNRNFDILINYYALGSTVMEDADFAFYQRGTKCTAVAKLLELYRDILLGYDSVMLLDDDVTISEEQIAALFSIRTEYDLDLLQPALSARSACHFPHLKQPLAGSGLRMMTAIEIMMPVVSRRALAEFGYAFSQAVSGWSVDLLLSKLVRDRFGDTIAMAADIVCEHLRPVDQQDGSYYRFLRDAGICPSAEAGEIAQRFGVNDKVNAIRPLVQTIL